MSCPSRRSRMVKNLMTNRESKLKKLENSEETKKENKEDIKKLMEMWNNLKK